eukprot:179105_1
MADLLDYKTGAGLMFMGLLALLVVVGVCIAVFLSHRGTDSGLVSVGTVSVLGSDIKNAPTLTLSSSEDGKDKLTLTGIPNHSGQVSLIRVSVWDSGFRKRKVLLTKDGTGSGGESVVKPSQSDIDSYLHWVPV